ncbi:hypothetical protein SYK_17480 [Pseudodesulfovibrio nedwellii]|uniref:DUF5666 domain-containing protein n=2 Tax=Pseudodesulfovibrio nedwellii TaxID=2973072 RepID=A0ABN6S4W7_9BACT|nr:hypothetical protein SYK_17480 [Pseudodesulfovibrio nedwellii]
MHNYSLKYSCIAMGSIALLLVLSAITASALMPPGVYAKASRESKIKAIATIVDVKTVLVGERYTSKDVTFTLEYALEAGVLDTFVGKCKSVDTEPQRTNALVGGDTYYYPEVGDRVFVTIEDDGGLITSMTSMTPELDQVVREEPERLVYGVTQVGILKKDGSGVEPVLRDKKALVE